MLKRLFGAPMGRIDPGAECFRAHFELQFGKPSRERTIYHDAAAPMIAVNTYRVPWDRRVRAFASIGLSHYTRQHAERAEVVLLVDAAYGEAEHAFRRIVGLLADEPSAFGLGETYGGRASFGSIASRFGKTAMALTSMTLGTLQHVDCQNGAGHVFVLVPITGEEKQFLAASGLAALEERLSTVDISDLERPSVA
jgi:hypothetical protein